MCEGFVGILDLKKDASIGVDGQTILLRTNDFLGIAGMERDGFHMISIRSQPHANIAVGFIVCDASSLPLVRKYDPQTEEVSSQSVDDETTRNLLEQIRLGQVPVGSVLDVGSIVSNQQRQQWKDQTNFILDSGILPKRRLHHGDKVIPGSFHDDDDDDDDDDNPSTKPSSMSTTSIDGKSITYPPIPVVDVSLSLRTHQHPGTRRHLSGLSPSERTKLFMESKIAGRLLRDVFALHFDDNWKTLLGDLQLAYVLFLYLQCLASLEHWKDLVAMLSLVDPSTIQAFPNLYQSFMEILLSQLSSIDKGFLDDIDEAGNNFLVPSLMQLCRNLTQSGIVKDESILQFQRLLSNKFPSMLEVHDDDDDDDDDNNDDDDNHDDNDYDDDERFDEKMYQGGDSSDDDDDDGDGPVVVDMEDIQASLARSSESPFPNPSRTSLPWWVVEKYPMLVAAIQPHEDILMTCARALDEKQDVSLVREAAAYLEEIEQRKLLD